MKVFTRASCLEGGDALTTAAGAVVERVVSVPGPRSLCEIQADEEDYQWLCNWASQLSPFQLRRWLEGVGSRRIALQSGDLNLSYTEATGCLLLLLASESARRKASEGQVWSAVRGRFAERSSRILFVQGQPREIFKVAIEAAARKLGLRHVFGIEGTQNYYLSVYLQFGFTQKGMERLAHWLAGQPSTQAIMYLLGDQGQRMASQSFVRLWEALRNYRRNNITESRSRQILADNPWVLPDWMDELLRQARRHQELGTADQGQADPGEQAPPQFMDNPRLRWIWPTAPVFSSAVVNLANFDLTSERYQIKIGSGTLTTLVAADDGVYSSHPQQVALPSGSPEFVVSMIDDHGVAQASQLLELWDGNEDVELFDLQTGRRLDAYGTQRAPSKVYGLLASSDLDIEPSDLPFDEMGAGSNTKRLYFLPSGAERPVRVTLAGEEIWSSSIEGGALPKPPEPDWAGTVTIEIMPTVRIELDRYEGSSIRVFGLGTTAELQYVRFGGRPLDFHLGEDGVYCTEKFDITREVARGNSWMLPEIKVKLGLRRGSEQTAVERTSILNVSGILRANADGWQVVDRQDKLLANDAIQSPFKVLLPPGHGQDANRLALLEGPVFLKKLWLRPRPLGQLGGYGAPLELRAPYNFTDFKMEVAAEIRAPGILEGILVTNNAKVRLYLRHPIDPSLGHKILLWSIGKSPVILDAVENVEYQGDEWDVSIPDPALGDGFIALAYDGARIGSWWPSRPDWSGISSNATAIETAAMLKWMHTPIVSPDWLDGIRFFAQQYPAQALSAWLVDEGLPADLEHGETEEQWRAAVRQVFSGWNPDGESAWEIIKALGASSPNDPVSEALQALLYEDPLLMGRIARIWARSPDLPCPGEAGDKLDLINRMRFLIAALDPQSEHRSQEPQQVSEDLQALLQQDPRLMKQFADELLNSQNQTDSVMAGGNRLEQREEELLEQTSTLMGLDGNFVKSIVRGVIDPLDYVSLPERDRFNAETALNTAPFREYLGLQVLSKVIQEIR